MFFKKFGNEKYKKKKRQEFRVLYCEKVKIVLEIIDQFFVLKVINRNVYRYSFDDFY